MGERGPVPKRSTQRRRTNSPAPQAVTVAPAPGDAPRPNSKWHPVAKRWFESLGQSGQSRFYEPSDWATAYLIAESISRELRPQPVRMGESTEMVLLPPKGASLAAWLKGMSTLLVTEGDRRRVQLELARPEAAGEDGDAHVSWIDDARERLRGGG